MYTFQHILSCTCPAPLRETQDSTQPINFIEQWFKQQDEMEHSGERGKHGNSNKIIRVRAIINIHMKIRLAFLLVSLFSLYSCVADKSLSRRKVIANSVISSNYKNINLVFAQRTGSPYRDYMVFKGGSTSATYTFIPVSYTIIEKLFNEQKIFMSIDKRFIVDTTTDISFTFVSLKGPRTPQWITSEWIHKTALRIQQSKSYQLDSVLIRTGYSNADKDDLIFYVFHDVRNPTVGGRPSGNYASIGEDAVRARSYVFGVLNKQVVYYKDHFYKAGDIRKLDSAQVAKITYSLFEDFFNAVKN